MLVWDLVLDQMAAERREAQAQAIGNLAAGAEEMTATIREITHQTAEAASALSGLSSGLNTVLGEISGG